MITREVRVNLRDTDLSVYITTDANNVQISFQSAKIGALKACDDENYNYLRGNISKAELEELMAGIEIALTE